MDNIEFSLSFKLTYAQNKGQEFGKKNLREYTYLQEDSCKINISLSSATEDNDIYKYIIKGFPGIPLSSIFPLRMGDITIGLRNDDFAGFSLQFLDKKNVTDTDVKKISLDLQEGATNKKFGIVLASEPSITETVTLRLSTECDKDQTKYGAQANFSINSTRGNFNYSICG